MSMLFGSSWFLREESTCPATENSSSDGQEVDGKLRYFLTAGDMTFSSGLINNFSFHHAIISVFRTTISWLRYSFRATMPAVCLFTDVPFFDEFFNSTFWSWSSHTELLAFDMQKRWKRLKILYDKGHKKFVNCCHLMSVTRIGLDTLIEFNKTWLGNFSSRNTHIYIGLLSDVIV